MEHEYALLGGVSRAKVGHMLSGAAALISAGAVFGILSVFQILSSLGLHPVLTPSIMSLISAGAVFFVLYWFLDNYAWRWSWVGRALKVPNLSGEWECSGKTLDSQGNILFDWTASVVIVQSWDKIRVRLRTDQSGSNSTSAALIWDQADGYRLFYSYKNDPRINQPELSPHRGFAEITFDKTLKAGRGEYFNGHGRYTFGTMTLRRD